MIFSLSFCQDVVKPYKYYVYYYNSSDAPVFEKNDKTGLSQYMGSRKDLKSFFDRYRIISSYQAMPSYPVENILRVYIMETYDKQMITDYLNSFPALVEKYEDLTNNVIELGYYPNDYGSTNPNGNQGANIERKDLDYIDAPKAWDITTGKNVKLGISDARIKPDDPDFVNKITFLPEYTYGSTSYNPGNDETFHGTSVAALAAAQGNNGYASTGVCYDCKILAVTYGNYNGLMALAKAGARVINMSWSRRGDPADVEQDAINYLANQMGVVLVAAAGNVPSHQTENEFYCSNAYYDVNQDKFVPYFTGIQILYPASYNNVISVSSVEYLHTDLSESYCCTSPPGIAIGGNVQDSYSPNIDITDLDHPVGLKYNGWPQYCQHNGIDYLASHGIVYMYTYNEFVDMLAPANPIYNHVKFAEEGGTIAYYNYGGTSSATPLVSGTAALMVDIYRCITPQEVDSILKLTAKDVVNMPINEPFKDYIGAGKLETGNAVEFVNEMKKSDGEAYIRNHIFNRFKFNLERINNNLSIENVTFKDNCIADFTAKNKIHLLPGTHLAPNNSGYIHLKAGGEGILNYCFLQSNTSRKGTDDTETEINNENMISISPNPINSGSVLNIVSDNNAEKNVQIFDFSGRQVLNTYATDSIKISVAAGVYIVRITENGKITTKKLVVK